MMLHRTSRMALAASLILAPFGAQPLAASDANNKDNSSVATKEVAVPAAPPVAEKREHTYTYHGITIRDPYDWLYDKSYPEIDDEDVLDYVKAENAWFEANMDPLEAQT
ncbi:MAG: S9 family peptidase, partial [Pseudomonadota bacterium]